MHDNLYYLTQDKVAGCQPVLFIFCGLYIPY